MIKLVLLVVLPVIIGCSGNSAPAIPPTSGDFVKNDNGFGTAHVFGIDFSVRVNSSGASTNDSIHADLVNPQNSSARKRFTLGDDIAIELKSISESKVQFMFNDQNFGLLNVGDKVIIDDERNVLVNGIARTANPQS